MVVITVRFRLKAGHEAAFLERMKQQARESLDREPACRHFDVCLNPTDARSIFLYEIYDDAASFSAHLQTPHFLSFDAETKSWVEDKAIERWERV